MIDKTDKDWWLYLDIQQCNTPDEIEDAIFGLDEVVQSIWSQIETAKIQSNNGQQAVDEKWFYSANTAYNKAKQKRKMLQEKKVTAARKLSVDSKVRENKLLEKRTDALTSIADSLRKIAQMMAQHND